MSVNDTVSADGAVSADAGLVTRNCPSCGFTRHEPTRYGRGVWRVGRCRNCGFVFLLQAPSYERLEEEFEWQGSARREADRRLRDRPLLTRFDRATRFRLRVRRRRSLQFLARHVPRGDIINLGCGACGDAIEAVGSYRMFGIDISPVSIEKAKQRCEATGGLAICAPVLAGLKQFDSAMFDGAILHAYLEHELAPREVLEELARVMKPGAVAVVKVPNYATLNRVVMGNEWCGFRHPDHVNYFTPRSMRDLADKTGFDAKIGPTDAYPIRDNLWATLVRR